MGEEYLTRNVYEHWLEAQGLEPEPRLKRLRQWVLPGELHPTYRLQATFTSLDTPEPILDGILTELDDPEAEPAWRRGGHLVAPAIDLVHVAKQRGKLDDLATQIDLSPVSLA